MDWEQVRLTYLLTTFPAMVLSIDLLQTELDDDIPLRIAAVACIGMWVIIAATQLHYFFRGIT